MKKIVIIIGALILVIGGLFIINKLTSPAVLQVIEYDNSDDTSKVVKEISIKNGDVINLEKYSGNEVEVIEVKANGVKISREAIRYMITENSNIESEDGEKDILELDDVAEYYETVIQELKYEETTAININSYHPLMGAPFTQPRYSYSIKFIKK